VQHNIIKILKVCKFFMSYACDHIYSVIELTLRFCGVYKYHVTLCYELWWLLWWKIARILQVMWVGQAAGRQAWRRICTQYTHRVSTAAAGRRSFAARRSVVARYRPANFAVLLARLCLALLCPAVLWACTLYMCTIAAVL
jgi:hypothetical protein